MKYISILPLGMEVIINGDCEANKFINEILDLGYGEDIHNIAKSFKELNLKKASLKEKQCYIWRRAYSESSSHCP